jgi:gas vesicle protein
MNIFKIGFGKALELAFFAGVTAGAVVGAIAGLATGLVAGSLTAPKAGEDLREDILTKSRALANRMLEKSDELSGQLSDKGKELRCKAGRVKDVIAEEFGNSKSGSGDAVEGY